MDLKKIRWSRNLKQEELARLVGVSQRTVYSWENGTMPHWRNVKKIADVLGVEEGTVIDAILESRSGGES